MLGHKEPQRIFGVIQGAIFVFVAVTAYLYRRRQKLHEKDAGARLTTPDLRQFIRRTPVPTPSRAQADTPGAPDPRAALESAFPSWTSDTPPHEILGVSPQATPAEIESAYKGLLKKYHPDRFASWGQGYQTRAHHVLLLAQDARTRMLGR